MNEQILEFFDQKADALLLYKRFEERVLSEIDGVHIKVQKTQISFSTKYMFACVSFARIRKKKDCPDSYIVVTFGVGHKVDSPRIEVATEPYPNRWTHHLLISETDQIDDQLMAWIKEASVFAASKR